MKDYLPDDVLTIIREYSKPLTIPDWRKGSCFKRHNPRFIVDIQVYLILKKLILNFQWHTFLQFGEV